MRVRSLLVGSLLVVGACAGGSVGGGPGGAGTGGPGAAGATGAAGTGSFAAPADATAYCNASQLINCDQVYRCFSADERAVIVDFVGTTIEECKGPVRQTVCATATTDCPMYSAPFAQACLNKVAPMSCASLLSNPAPQECNFACMQ